MEYKVVRTCMDCKNVDEIFLTKIEIAFEKYRENKIKENHCSNCGSENYDSIGYNYSELDKELLDIWGNDAELFLMPQDEDLLLADMKYFAMVLDAIDNSDYLKHKKSILIDAICVLLYDNTANRDQYSAEESKNQSKIAEKVLKELIIRKEIIMTEGDYLMDYIKEVVYPQIGINI